MAQNTAPITSPAAGIGWLADVDPKDFDSATAYLSLRVGQKAADAAVGRLKKATVTTRRANDILRAARLEPASLADPGVLKDLVRVLNGKKLSPVLVVQTESGADIADGYHRVSLVYQIDPYAEIPLRLA